MLYQIPFYNPNRTVTTPTMQATHASHTSSTHDPTLAQPPQPPPHQGQPGLQSPALRVLHYSPQHGQEGTPFTVALQVPQLEKTLKLGFGTLIVDTKQLNTPSYATLSTNVPAFSLTKWNSGRVPVYILVLDNDTVVDSRYFGDFTYEDRKRPSSDFSDGGELAARKRVGRVKAEDDIYLSNVNYPSLYQHQIAPSRPQNPLPQQWPPAKGYDDPQRLNLFSQYTSPYVYGLGVSTGLNMGMGAGDFSWYGQAAPQSQPTTPNHPGNQPPLPQQQPQQGQQAPGQMHGHSPTDAQAQQRGGRTYQPPLPGASTPAVSLSNYNFYASLLNKANLKFSGNLDDMARNWSQEEWENRRRLVQFWRKQEANDIHCSFAPVSPADCSPNSIVVSCIYWQEKNDCYITSVDCIYLMESLIGVRFTVEEKNRIRRNLEGFRPSTVSKCKPESAEFFKLIMSFPNPKPRNIEKDVKVFPWRVLPFALKKIISKYTASYSSTASVNMDAIQSASAPASAYPVSSLLHQQPSISNPSAAPSAQASYLDPLGIPDQHAHPSATPGHLAGDAPQAHPGGMLGYDLRHEFDGDKNTDPNAPAHFDGQAPAGVEDSNGPRQGHLMVP
ncbi:uncharacterized protein VTP21DRAFT_6932 [Calcarisporiella thermophila]|uniref:uncharacterized protein n=1 Tax=Calcarisporiella thermophila TaxID=911321 RepID=UPI003742088D